MILSDRMLKAAMLRGDIVIEPFDPQALGTNSYDVHLGPVLKTYTRINKQSGHDLFVNEWGVDETARVVLDCKIEQPTRDHVIPPAGYVLRPGMLYLGSTVEYTETKKHVPFVDGKSSIGRLGITIHCTAGKGDRNFSGYWTLEIHVVEPVRVYANMPIGQLIYFETGDVDMPYDKKPSAKYNNRDPAPQASKMWMNFKDSK